MTYPVLFPIHCLTSRSPPSFFVTYLLILVARIPYSRHPPPYSRHPPPYSRYPPFSLVFSIGSLPTVLHS